MRSFCDADFEEILHISKHHNPYTEIISNGAGEDVLIEDQYYSPFKSRNIASEFRKSKKTVTFDPHEAKRLQKTQQSFWNTKSNPNIHYSKPEKSRNRVKSDFASSTGFSSYSRHTKSKKNRDLMYKTMRNENVYPRTLKPHVPGTSKIRTRILKKKYGDLPGFVENKAMTRRHD